LFPFSIPFLGKEHHHPLTKQTERHLWLLPFPLPICKASQGLNTWVSTSYINSPFFCLHWGLNTGLQAC
jgi:hypothetical protein